MGRSSSTKSTSHPPARTLSSSPVVFESQPSLHRGLQGRRWPGAQIVILAECLLSCHRQTLSVGTRQALSRTGLCTSHQHGSAPHDRPTLWSPATRPGRPVPALSQGEGPSLCSPLTLVPENVGRTAGPGAGA